MEPREYELMFRAEDRHWWYQSLRAMIAAAWTRHVRAPYPDALDIGCGTGALMTWLASRANATGLDFSPHALAFSRKRGLTRILRADAAALPLDAASFDVAVSCDVLYHKAVGDPLVVLKEACRVLKPSGVVMINVPAYPWLQSTHDIGIHTARRFTKYEVIALFNQAGFSHVYATYWNTLLFPAAAAVRLWRRGTQTHTEQSDLADIPSPIVNSAMSAILGLERAILRICPLPFGLSVFAVASRPGSPGT
jgi:ubiquinone/menaquinone biosynthesis C-methylase UbiE